MVGCLAGGSPIPSVDELVIAAAAVPAADIAPIITAPTTTTTTPRLTTAAYNGKQQHPSDTPATTAAEVALAVPSSNSARFTKETITHVTAATTVRVAAAATRLAPSVSNAESSTSQYGRLDADPEQGTAGYGRLSADRLVTAAWQGTP
mmetsp:Transcript_16722/g.30383  ORF Transcript_16722/g.30383 Transcript_16722/m.30383 type:complete len:149 (-) Transcript_16722:1936-2382(-)